MFTQLGRSLGSLLSPLRRALDEAAHLETLLAAAGWEPEQPVSDAAVAALASALGVGDDLDMLLALVDDEMSVLDAAQAVAAGSSVLARLTELATADSVTLEATLVDVVAALPAPLIDTEAFLAALDDIGQVLLGDWLQAHLPSIAAALRLGGVASGADPGRVDWARLPRLVSEPGTFLRDTYGWGGVLPLAPLDGAIRAAAELLPVPLQATAVDRTIWDRYWGADAPVDQRARQYLLTLIDGASAVESGLAGDAGLALIPVPEGPNADPAPTRLLLAPVAQAGASGPIRLDDEWSARVTAGADLTGVAGLLIVPTEDGGIEVQRETGSPSLDFEVMLSAPERTWFLGDSGGPRIEASGLDVQVGVRDRNGVPEPFLKVGATLAFIVAPPGSDGFLRHIMGAGLDASIDAAIDVSTAGVRVSGAAGSTVVVPLRLPLGPLWIEVLVVRLSVSDDSIALVAGFDLTFVLGPLIAGINGIGLALVARAAPNGDGTLGQLDLRLAFTPPDRIWFVVDSRAVRGGGSLERQTDRWVGGLILDVLTVGIDAFTIIDTSLPDDAEGFALFATLTARFPGIPLGFGFTLNGVGGLLALNRTLDAEALAAGLRSGVIDSLLFPDDPLGDAAQLTAQIDEYFPLRDGNTVVGPVIRIGWGSPTLISAQLGVVISLPDGIIAVMGSIEALLPTPDAPLLTLHMDSLGVIDLGAGTFTLTASLYDSRLLETIDLSGDMAMYLQATARPYFLLSVGGFHPGFAPPSVVPASMHDLRRMQAAIRVAANVSVSVKAYFALTSNSVQFGASVNVEASVEIWPTTYTAIGWFGFDVLLVFSPFKIIASMSAGVGIYSGNKELMGVQLGFLLEGPKPWFASGYASFKFFGIKVAFELEVGSKAAGEPKPIAHPRASMVAALRSPSSWSEVPPADGLGAGITYTSTGTDGEDTVWVRPDHQLMARQSVAPLERRLEIVGQAIPAPGEDLMTVTGAGIRGLTQDIEWQLATDWFAPAQFEALGRTDKLTRASYEEMTAGVTFGAPAAAITSDPDALGTSVTLDYEEGTLADSVRTGAAGVGLRHRPTSPAAPWFRIGTTSYTVVGTADGVVAAAVLDDLGLVTHTVSQREAMNARNHAIADDDAMATELVVVPLASALEPGS